MNPRTDTRKHSLLYCYVIVASTEALPCNALISCCRDVFTAALPNNERGVARHSTARQGENTAFLSVV
jgi:hypothetical protein